MSGPSGAPSQSDHDLLIKLSNDMDWLKARVGEVCGEVWDKHPREHMAIERRLQGLERVDSSQAAVGKEKKDGMAIALIVVGLIISLGIGIAGLVWG